jgi:hypothetical protein
MNNQPTKCFKQYRAELFLLLTILGLAALLLYTGTQQVQAQTNTPGFNPPGNVTRTSQAPADVGYQTAVDVVSATVSYFGYAPSTSPSPITLTVTGITKANPGVVTVTSHGYHANATPLVYITGATGEWAAINGLHVFTYASANTFTIDVDTSGFTDTYASPAQTPTYTTRAVRTTDPYWSIYKQIKDGSGNVIWTGWASGLKDATATNSNKNLGGSSQFKFAWGSRASYGYQ